MSTYLCIHCSQSFTFEHYFIGSLSERYINRKVTKRFLRRIIGRINYIWTFLRRTSNSILRPIKISSLKLKKSKWYSCKSFEVNEWWGMHSDVVVIKYKSNESELAKKKCSFLDYFFFNRSLKLVHTADFGPDCSTVTMQDSRCRHTYVYIVHKVLPLSATL